MSLPEFIRYLHSYILTFLVVKKIEVLFFYACKKKSTVRNEGGKKMSLPEFNIYLLTFLHPSFLTCKKNLQVTHSAIEPAIKV
jgi:hypothetical protein